MMNLTQRESEILRALAEKYMSYATLPAQAERRHLWEALNSLHMEKPLVTIDQMPWNELNTDGSLTLQVEEPTFREVEKWLRRQIYKWEHLPVDMVLDPYILVPRPVRNTGYSLPYQVHRLIVDKTNSVSAQRFDNQLQEPEDVEKIKDPVITLDRAEEKAILETAERVFAGIAPVKLQGIMLHLGLWDAVTQWMGVTNCYMELMDRPEFIHAIMDRVTNATLAAIRQVNELGVQDVTGHICHCSYTFGDLPGKDCDPEHPTTYDGWGYGMAQLFSSVSPAITEEFEVPYMQRLFPYYGAIYYGCCDRLDDRLDIIYKMPNIRKISCSPWSDREAFAAKLDPKYIMSNKPNPALLAWPTFDENAVREDLRRTITAAKANGLGLEMLLKDISTVRYQPERLWRWAEIAAEETLRAAE